MSFIMYMALANQNYEKAEGEEKDNDDDSSDDDDDDKWEEKKE